MAGWRAALMLAVLSFGAASAAGAQSIDYDPRRPASLRPCDDQRHRGRVAEARTCYQRLLTAGADPLVRAEATWALGDIRQANELYREATRADDRSAYARTRWGRLFLHTHQYADAQTLFQEAIERDRGDRQARLGIARMLVERFDPQARDLVDQLLSEDEQLVEANLLSARMDLEAGQLEAAQRALDRAMALTERQRQPPLEVLSLLAALDLLRGDETARRWIQRAQSYNPRYGGIYETLAHFETIRRRYRQAIAWLRRAVEVQPDLWTAHAELGVNLLRIAEMDEARRHLELAYSGDPFSATTVNTLRLLDSLNDFEVERVASPGLVTRLHRNEAAALRPYVQQLARASIATFSRRYGFEPREPVVVELYPDHDDFAVRTAGLPGIGLLGVAFGYVVAMDSPSGRPTGEFHWGSTLWHEIAHVFTLSVTDHRVPRWLSEGISVFEEWRTGPAPGVVVTPTALAAFRDGRFLPVATLDEGFIRPSYPAQVQVSYVQAGLVCLFIEERWGFERLVALLRQFTRDTTTAAAVQATFRIAPEEFDRQFKAFMERRFESVLPRLDEWQQVMRAAHEADRGESWSAVIGPAQRAIEIFPEFTSTGSAHLLLARAYERLGRRDDAIRVLMRYRELGGWDPEALRQLAQWLDQAGRAEETLQILDALNYVDPLNAPIHARQGELLLAANRADDALREFRVLLALNPQDRAAANFGMARALYSLGDATNGRRHLLDALETAPHYRPAQDLLLEKVGERNQ